MWKLTFLLLLTQKIENKPSKKTSSEADCIFNYITQQNQVSMRDSKYVLMYSSYHGMIFRSVKVCNYLIIAKKQTTTKMLSIFYLFWQIVTILSKCVFLECTMKPKLNAECQKNRIKRLKSKGEHENMLIWAYTFITNKITRNFNMVLQCAIHNSNKYFIKICWYFCNTLQ